MFSKANISERLARSAATNSSKLLSLERATKTLRGITGFEVLSLKGKVEKGKVTEYRVTLEVSFILE